ncbi:MAG: VanZ family protein [Psychrobium sp.]
MQKYFISLAICFFIFILWAIYVANTGQSNGLFNVVSTLPYGDKIGHFCLFGILTLFANLATRCRTFKMKKFSIYWGSFSVWIFVTIEELSQHFLPTRTLDIYDYIADLIGIIIFSCLAFLLNSRFNLRNSSDK